MRAIIILLALVALSTIARSDGIYNPTGGQVGFADGINNLGAGTGGGGGGSCTGTIDLSKGCALPMLGGL